MKFKTKGSVKKLLKTQQKKLIVFSQKKECKILINSKYVDDKL